MFDLPGIDQIFDRAGHLLDRHVGVDPVLVVQVDHVQPESRREPSTAPARPSGRSIRPRGLRSTGSMSWANLVAMTTLVGVSGQGFAEEFLVGVRTVDLSGVEECDTKVHGTI